jgi:hypothetical protein
MGDGEKVGREVVKRMVCGLTNASKSLEEEVNARLGGVLGTETRVGSQGMIEAQIYIRGNKARCEA